MEGMERIKDLLKHEDAKTRRYCCYDECHERHEGTRSRRRLRGIMDG
jgi:hypothetical protein